MNIDEVLKAKFEAQRFLERVAEFEESESKVFEGSNGRIYKCSNRTESAALKRSSLDLYMQLAKMRNSR